ncbi:MAG: TRAP transporter substrate-binding protein [Alphaproteobacteria bacterium]|nr:TRAP transporter substrate-binding protein [Alphaproteobacteria bacterium]
MRLRTLISAGVAFVFGLGLAAAPASAQQSWKVQTSMVAGDAYYKMIQDHWLDRLAAMTGGQVKIELTPIGSVVPHTETMNAIGQGILQGDLTSTTYFAGRDKVFALMGDLIAGYDTPLQLTMFCYHGGGREILQEAFDRYSGGTVQVIGCGAIAKEALVSKARIATLADLKGKKIRSPEGLAAEVFRRAGAAPVAMPPSETYTALDKGVVDAADNSSYTMDKSVGMHKVAKFPIYPGIHSMPIIQFTVNKAMWNRLSPQTRQAVDSWYLAMIYDLTMRNELQDRVFVAQDKADKSSGIEIIDWSQPDRDAFRAIAAGAWKDFAEGSPLAKKAYDANIAFMQKMGLLAK